MILRLCFLYLFILKRIGTCSFATIFPWKQSALNFNSKKQDIWNFPSKYAKKESQDIVNFPSNYGKKQSQDIWNFPSNYGKKQSQDIWNFPSNYAKKRFYDRLTTTEPDNQMYIDVLSENKHSVTNNSDLLYVQAFASEDTIRNTKTFLKSNSSSSIPMQNTLDFRRQSGGRFSDWWFWNGATIATCYFCGFDESYVPWTADCHDVFESDDWITKARIKWFKAECKYRSSMFSKELDYRRKDVWIYIGDKSWIWSWDRRPGYKLQILSKFWQKGCFKRYLDVGKIYTQRGCRRQYPVRKMYGVDENFAVARYAALESSLHRIKNGCRASPAASLTPFARSISLWAHYHVCVCEGKYCNGAQMQLRTHTLLYLSSLFLIYF